MNELCGSECCSRCELHEIACAGCAETGAHPCEKGSCAAAEVIQERGLGAMYVQEMAIAKEVNALQLPGLTVGELQLLMGSYINLEHPMPSGERVKFLDDKRVYWATQEIQENDERCYGVVADQNFLLICEYGPDGSDPEVLLYKKRG